MKTLFFILTLFTFSTSFAQVDVDSFKTFIAPLQLKFEMPEKYKSVPIIENGDLYYNFAMINKKKNIQVRYTITDLRPWMEKYEESLKDTNTTMLHPNKLYRSAIMANMLNLSGGQFYEISYFPAESVKKEFGADDGGSVFLEFNSSFGTGYKYGQVIFLHLDNICDVYITFMTNDIAKHVDLMMESFYALTFQDTQ